MIPAFPQIGILISILSMVLGIIVIYNARKTLNKPYVLYFISSTITASLWILVNTVLLPKSIIDLNTLVSISFACSIIMITSIWKFAINFGNKLQNKGVIILDTIFIIIGFLFFFSSIFTKLIIIDTTQTDEKLILEFGALYILFSIYFMAIFISIAFILVYKYRKEMTKKKSQLLYFSSGFLLTALISVITNLVLPYITGDSSSSRIGPFGMIFFLSFSTFAIIRYQFLDIRVLFARITYYSIIGSIFVGAFYGFYFLYKYAFGGSETVGALLMSPFNALIFAYLFVRFNDYLRTEVRSKIINPGYDPLEVTDKLSRHMATLLGIREIADSALDTLAQTIRANYEAVIVIPGDPDKKTITIESSKSKKQFDCTKFESLKHIWGEIGKEPIILDELEVEIPEKLIPFKDEIDEIQKCMKKEGIKLIVPLRQSKDNTGMIILGQKESDSPYTGQDIEFIQGIATAVGLAVTRSIYYLEVQDLNENLQQKVDDATEELSDKNASLKDALAKLEEVRRRERDMVDVMGHELRTPITIVRNALLLLHSKLSKGQTLPKEKILDYVDKAIESSRREIDLVETLLSATKVESNRVQLTLNKIDLLDVIYDGMEAHKNFAKDRAIEVKYDKPKEEFWGYADRTRIQEIMDNLLSNAIKYTPKGHVEITIKETSDDYTAISITDTGMGIHPEDIRHLGKKFYRAKQYLNNKNGSKNNVVRPGGTGLGLYVSFNLAKLMNGRIVVKSELGKGSTFAIYIPKFTGQKEKYVDQVFE